MKRRDALARPALGMTRAWGQTGVRLAVDRRSLWPLPGYPAPEGVEPRLLDLARWFLGIVAGRPKP